MKIENLGREIDARAEGDGAESMHGGGKWREAIGEQSSSQMEDANHENN